jgi:hypothetical protein
VLKIWRWSISILAFIFIQIFTGKYGTTWPDCLDVFLWASGLIGPTLTITYCASRAIRSHSARSRAACNEQLYRHCRWLSIAFLAMIAFILIAEPWLVWWNGKELLTLSSIFLQFLSCALSGMLVSFFMSN